LQFFHAEQQKIEMENNYKGTNLQQKSQSNFYRLQNAKNKKGLKTKNKIFLTKQPNGCIFDERSEQKCNQDFLTFFERERKKSQKGDLVVLLERFCFLFFAFEKSN
jgi:hypothetical protein